MVSCQDQWNQPPGWVLSPCHLSLDLCSVTNAVKPGDISTWLLVVAHQILGRALQLCVRRHHAGMQVTPHQGALQEASGHLVRPQ